MNQKEKNFLQSSILRSWKRIAPFWELKHAIATNPLTGFQDMQFENALTNAQLFFQQKDLPEQMHQINRQTLKWLQVFFDEGQSIVTMPLRHEGLLKSVLQLLPFDSQLDFSDKKKHTWFANLSADPEAVIAECLSYLQISQDEYEQCITLLLTTLSGWSSYIHYRTDWDLTRHENKKNPVTKEEYTALRLVLTCLLWPEAKYLLTWHKAAAEKVATTQTYRRILENEKKYSSNLIDRLVTQEKRESTATPDAQFIFCIDVRSEPFRRALESQGNYETFGIAGFFGLAVAIKNVITKRTYASCPALISPIYTIEEKPKNFSGKCTANYQRLHTIKHLYQSVKYNFTTPLALVETLGFLTSLWMACKTFFPGLAAQIKRKIQKKGNFFCELQPDIASIPFEAQVTFAYNALQMIGLTKNFAPLVFLCGHRSTTQNNPHATLLDCGACGGNPGGQNARILATVLNKQEIRTALAEKSITIPETTLFISAEHNTTTDEMDLFDLETVPETTKRDLKKIKKDFDTVRTINSAWRCAKLDIAATDGSATHATKLRSKDWAQTRPEWGLAGNASFIVGQRSLSKNIDLEGRTFLHSYDWQQDEDGTVLTKILTAPVIVAHWINMQYFFSTLDNVAFGAGSKITTNATGKIGVMQGNASDLMTGLPLQSVFNADEKAYHELMRLTVIVYAPKNRIDNILAKQNDLQKLFANGWMHLICIDPETNDSFYLQRDFSWKKYDQ